MRKRTLIILIALGLFGIGLTVFRVFFTRMARVPSGSMANTIIPGDHILITKTFGQLERGEIVMFQHDPNVPNARDQYREDPSTFYLARVVGLPGETIQIRGTTVYINERPLQEQKVTIREVDYNDPLEELSTEGNGPYRVFYSSRSDDERSAISDDLIFGGQTPFQIPKDSYFVMGDNRDNSEDSRYRGAVPRELIWGKAVMVYYSTAMKTDEPRWDRVFKKIR